MEEPPEPQSPRKRQRLGSPNAFSKPNDETAAGQIGQIPSMDASTPQSTADAQLKKETEVGIAEFVSPDLPGFTGILKKRSSRTRPQPPFVLMLILSQIYRLSGQ